MEEKDRDYRVGTGGTDEGRVAEVRNAGAPEALGGDVHDDATADVHVDEGKGEVADAANTDGVADKEGVVPPPYREGDAERDLALLRAIATHPKAAQFLAELAAGGQEAELVRKYFPREPAMYQAPAEVQAEATSQPVILSLRRRGFWD